ncbi:hypothetical protein LXL04_027639 [Taraxacum kok-saghyz]
MSSSIFDENMFLPSMSPFSKESDGNLLGSDNSNMDIIPSAAVLRQLAIGDKIDMEFGTDEKVKVVSVISSLLCAGKAMATLTHHKKFVRALAQHPIEDSFVVCLSDDVETNECLENNGGCWHDKSANVTACKDTFRGKVCECPLIDGVQFKGDGYTSCVASVPGRCKINKGGCWHESREVVWITKMGNVHVLQGLRGSCKNTWGSYECSCGSDLLYIRDHDTYISKTAGKGGLFS